MTREDLDRAISTFISKGGVSVKFESKSKMPAYLKYNGGMTARGRIRGQIGPSRQFRLGFPTGNFMANH